MGLLVYGGSPIDEISVFLSNAELAAKKIHDIGSRANQMVLDNKADLRKPPRAEAKSDEIIRRLASLYVQFLPGFIDGCENSAKKLEGAFEKYQRAIVEAGIEKKKMRMRREKSSS